MPALNQARYPAPSDWQEFQRLICDLFKEVWNDRYTHEFGSQGQRQFGIDIFGSPNGGLNIEGVQCKCVNTISQSEVRAEYEDSKNFEPKLSCFIIATTAPRDARVQRMAATLSQEGDYRCVVLFWQDICNMFSDHPDVLKKYYSDFFIFETVGDSPGKLIKVDIDTNHYELMISKLSEADSHYGGTILVCDLLNRKCQTYRIGDHWNRLDGFVGYGKFDAFLVSSFLNDIGDVDKLLNIGRSYLVYKPTPMQLNNYFSQLGD